MIQAVNMFGGIFDYFVSTLSALVQYLVQALALVFVVIYLVFMGIALICLFAETAFKRIAGIEAISFQGNPVGTNAPGSENGQDLVYAFIMDSSVQNVFWAILALSLVLLLIFTIIAMIKSEFTLDLKGSAKGPIISRALKSLANFIIVPVTAIIGIIGVNFLSKTIYSLFEPGKSNIVTRCFIVGGYDANRARRDEEFAAHLASGDFLRDGENIFQGKTQEEIADMIDNAFLNYQEYDMKYEKFDFFDRVSRDANDEYTDWNMSILAYPLDSTTTFSIFNVFQVNYYYKLFYFNFILGIGAAIVIAWILLTVCLVLLKRVFELAILFILAPPMIAIAPLDGGQAEKKWRGEFIKRVLAVVGPIFAFNMFFLFVPMFESISLFSGAGLSIGVGSGLTMISSAQAVITEHIFMFDIFFQLICVMVGLQIIKEASSLLSNLLGIEDLVKSGGEASKKALATGMKAAAVATGVGGVAIKGVAATAKMVGGTATGAARKLTKGGRMRRAGKGELEEGVSGAEENLDVANKEVAQAEEAVKRNPEYSKYQSAKNTFADLEKKGYHTLNPEQQKEYHEAKKTIKGVEDKAGLTDAKAKKEKAEAVLSSAISDRSGGQSKAFKAEVEKRRLEGDEKGALKLEKQAAGSHIWQNVKGAWTSEFGRDQKTTSFGAKVQKSLEKSKLVGEEGRLPIGKTFAKGLGEFLNPDKFSKRRLNDSLAGIFGETGGELYKMWFNKNARAKLWESVPETKMRTAGIETGLSWGAKYKYDEKLQKEKAQKEDEMFTRRYIAEKKGVSIFSERLKLENDLKNAKRDAVGTDERGNPKSARIDQLNAEIEKFDLRHDITKEARSLINNVKGNPDSADAKNLQDYKNRLRDAGKQEAFQSELDQSQSLKEKVKGYKTKDNKKIETDMSHTSISELIAAMKAMFSEKSLKIDSSFAEALGNILTKKLGDPQATNNQMQQIAASLKELATAINALSGNTGSSGSKELLDQYGKPFKKS